MCSRKPIFKLALTGTPIPNTFKDIYNCIKILYPDDIYGTLNYLCPSRLEKADNNESIETEVRETLQPIFVRTTKNDLCIPPAEPDDTYSLLAVPSDNEKLILKYTRDSYGNNILLLFIRLIQASSNPELLLKSLNKSDIINCLDEDDDELENLINSAKNDVLYKDELKDLIANTPNSTKYNLTVSKIKNLTSKNEKVIVWCLFIDTIDKLNRNLLSMGIKSTTITGRDDPVLRNKRIDEFKYGNTQVLITNPNTLAESISLHKVCHHAIYLEYGFNLTYLLQSKDRIHRVGLANDTKTYYYFAITDGDLGMGCIDKHIYNRLVEKADKMLRTVESNDLIPMYNSTDLEDIKAILKDMNL